MRISQREFEKRQLKALVLGELGVPDNTLAPYFRQPKRREPRNMGFNWFSHVQCLVRERVEGLRASRELAGHSTEDLDDLSKQVVVLSSVEVYLFDNPPRQGHLLVQLTPTGGVKMQAVPAEYCTNGEKGARNLARRLTKTGGL